MRSIDEMRPLFEGIYHCEPYLHDGMCMYGIQRWRRQLRQRRNETVVGVETSAPTRRLEIRSKTREKDFSLTIKKPNAPTFFC